MRVLSRISARALRGLILHSLGVLEFLEAQEVDADVNNRDGRRRGCFLSISTVRIMFHRLRLLRFYILMLCSVQVANHHYLSIDHMSLE